MARLSRQTKEIIKTVAVVLLIALILIVYMIYPLNRVKAMWGRSDIDTYRATLKDLPMNDPAAFTALGLVADTFRVESDGATSIAGVFLHDSAKVASRGTFVLVPSERTDRSSLAPLSRALVDSGFAVVTYDQRATGSSTGKYHADGPVESGDLEALIGHLGVHNQLAPPVIVAGWKLGADAALLAATEEKRISAVLAVEPYLSSRRVIDTYRREFGGYWFPLYRTTTWFWFNIRTGYGAAYRDDAEVKAVACRTILMIPDTDRQSPEIEAITRLSGNALTSMPLPADQNKLTELLVTLATASNK